MGIMNRKPKLSRMLASLSTLTLCAATTCSQSYTLVDGDSRLDVNFGDPILRQTLNVDGVSITGETGYFTGFRHLGVNIWQTAPNELSVSWGFIRVFAGVDYRLENGSDSQATATVSETLWVLNEASSEMPFQLYGYNHYDLTGGGQPADRAVARAAGLIEQSGPLGTLEASTDAVPSHYQIGDPARLLEAVSVSWPDLAPDLTDTPRPGVPSPTAPGDVAFAYEWKPVVGFGHGKTVAVTTKRFTLNRPPDAVPEPGSLALLGVAGLGLVLRRRR